MRAFTFKSKGATIDFQKLEGKDKVRVLNLMNELQEFFFVFLARAKDGTQFSILLSRFKHSFETLQYSFKEHNGFFDKFADSIGMFVGYLSEEVAQFCSQIKISRYY